MARIADVKREDLSPRQQQLHDDFLKSRPRNTLTGPFSVLIHTPDIAEPADHLVNYYRSNPKLGRRLIELIILMLCRSATVQYAWSVHEPHALKEGITQDVIDAIRAKKRPDFKRDDERLIYDFVTELLGRQDRQRGDVRAHQSGLRPRRRHRSRHLLRPLRHDRPGAQRVRYPAAARQAAELEDRPEKCVSPNSIGDRIPDARR